MMALQGYGEGEGGCTLWLGWWGLVEVIKVSQGSVEGIFVRERPRTVTFIAGGA